jgi:hypothetical protein
MPEEELSVMASDSLEEDYLFNNIDIVGFIFFS